MLQFVFTLGLVGVALGPGFTQSTVQTPEERIVGGSKTSIADYPYMASIQHTGSHVCGGSIISEDYILTAAHCFEGGTSKYSVRTGSSEREEGGAVHKVSKIIVHEKYDAVVFYDYDVALVRLQKPVHVSPTAQPVQLPDKGHAVEEGTVGVVTGWGHLQESGLPSDTLQEVDISVVSIVPCNKTYWDLLTPRMFCGASEEDGHDACQGDSGGPMVADGKQIGIVSLGMGCGEKKFPGVYTNVAVVRDWIAEKSGV